MFLLSETHVIVGRQLVPQVGPGLWWCQREDRHTTGPSAELEAHLDGATGVFLGEVGHPLCDRLAHLNLPSGTGCSGGSATQPYFYYST